MTTTRDLMADREDSILSDAAEIMDAEREQWDHGWRYMTSEPQVGDTLEPSHERDDHGESLGELRGVSTLGSLDEVLRYAGWANDGYVVLVRGVRVGPGSLAGEQIMDEASVAAAWEVR